MTKSLDAYREEKPVKHALIVEKYFVKNSL